jgi:hypothetical protein
MNPMLHIERAGNDTATWLVHDKRSWLIMVVVFLARAGWRGSLGLNLYTLGDALWAVGVVGLAAAVVLLARSVASARAA